MLIKFLNKIFNKDVPNSIITDYLYSVAYSYAGIALFNHFVDNVDSNKISGIGIYSNLISVGFQLKVKYL